MLRRLVPVAYREVLTVGRFRQLTVGTGLSFLGDAMSLVAVPWLALDLAPPRTEALAISLAAIAYSLPGAAVGLLFATAANRVGSRRLILLDSGTRCLVLGIIPLLAWTGRLGIASYVSLLALSSIFRGWGAGGRIALVATLVDEPRFMAANSLVSAQSQLALVVGPAAAGVVIAGLGAPLVIAVDALSFAALFLAVATLPALPGPSDRSGELIANRGSGLGLVLRHPEVAGLFFLTLVFYLLYGPTELAIPLQVKRHLGGGAPLFGVLATAFGVGAIVGSLVAGAFERLPLWPTALGIVAGWGAAVVVLGATSVPVVAIVAVGIGGLIFAPYPAVVTTMLQASTPPRERPSVSSAWASLVTATTPIGIILGAPLVSALGPRPTLLISGGSTIMLSVIGTALLGVRVLTRRRSAPSPAIPEVTHGAAGPVSSGPGEGSDFQQP